MSQMILMLYILIFASGFAGLLSIAVMRIRIRSAVLIPLFITDFLLFLALALVAVYFYLENVQSLIGGDFPELKTTLSIISSVINIALYVALSKVAGGYLTHQERKRLPMILFRILCWTIIALLTVSCLFHIIGDGVYYLPLGITLYALIGICISLFGFLLYTAKAVGEHSAVRFLVRGTSIACFFYAPMSLLEFLLQQADIQPYHPISVEYLYFLCLTCLAVIAAIRSLGDGREASTLEISDDVAARYALTGREREMITLVARGLTNKEIAYELNISPATVRTHIYNLYQKTEVQSRIALINKMAANSANT